MSVQVHVLLELRHTTGSMVRNFASTDQVAGVLRTEIPYIILLVQVSEDHVPSARTCFQSFQPQNASCYYYDEKTFCEENLWKLEHLTIDHEFDMYIYLFIKNTF